MGRKLPARFRDRALRLRWNADTGYDEAWVEDWLITDRGLVGLGNAGTSFGGLALSLPAIHDPELAVWHCRICND